MKGLAVLHRPRATLRLGFLAALALLVCPRSIASTTVAPMAFSNACEAIAAWNGPTGNPEWTLVCIDPCTQGCVTRTVTLGPSTVGETCACRGSGGSSCCTLLISYVDGEQFEPVGVGPCGGKNCPPGDYCGVTEVDPEETSVAQCFFN